MSRQTTNVELGSVPRAQTSTDRDIQKIRVLSMDADVDERAFQLAALIQKQRQIRLLFQENEGGRAWLHSLVLMFLPMGLWILWIYLPLSEEAGNTDVSVDYRVQSPYLYVFVHHLLYLLVAVYFGILLFGVGMPLPSSGVQLVLVFFCIVAGCLVDFALLTDVSAFEHGLPLVVITAAVPFFAGVFFLQRRLALLQAERIKRNKAITQSLGFDLPTRNYLLQFFRIFMVAGFVLATYLFCQYFVYLFIGNADDNIKQFGFGALFQLFLQPFRMANIWFAKKVDEDNLAYDFNVGKSIEKEEELEKQFEAEEQKSSDASASAVSNAAVVPPASAAADADDGQPSGFQIMVTPEPSVAAGTAEPTEKPGPSVSTVSTASLPGASNKPGPSQSTASNTSASAGATVHESVSNREGRSLSTASTTSAAGKPQQGVMGVVSSVLGLGVSISAAVDTSTHRRLRSRQQGNAPGKRAAPRLPPRSALPDSKAASDTSAAAQPSSSTSSSPSPSSSSSSSASSPAVVSASTASSASSSSASSSSSSSASNKEVANTPAEPVTPPISPSQSKRVLLPAMEDPDAEEDGTKGVDGDVLGMQRVQTLNRLLSSAAGEVDIKAADKAALDEFVALNTTNESSRVLLEPIIEWAQNLFYLVFFRQLFLQVEDDAFYALIVLSLTMSYFTWTFPLTAWAAPKYVWFTRIGTNVLRKMVCRQWVDDHPINPFDMKMNPEELEAYRRQTIKGFYLYGTAERLTLISFVLVVTLLRNNRNRNFFPFNDHDLDEAEYAQLMFYCAIMFIAEWGATILNYLIIRNKYQLDVMRVGSQFLSSRGARRIAHVITLHILMDSLLTINNCINSSIVMRDEYIGNYYDSVTLPNGTVVSLGEPEFNLTAIRPWFICETV